MWESTASTWLGGGVRGGCGATRVYESYSVGIPWAYSACAVGYVIMDVRYTKYTSIKYYRATGTERRTGVQFLTRL